MLAWHFLPDDGRLQFGRRSKVNVGQTLRRDPNKLKLCVYGLHASVKPLDAIMYAPGSIICRVKLGGRIIEGTDKCVASRRTVLWMADASRELRLFGCWCVRNVELADGLKVWDLLTDERSKTAVEVAERYVDGLATGKELIVARAAALVAAWHAARAARDAAWIAARVASMNAAEVARDAAWIAAMVASMNAARVASWSVGTSTRDAENKALERMLLALEE